MHYSDDTPVRLLPDVASRVVAGEALIVDLRSGHYFGLDPVGTRIWELIADRGTFGGILEGVTAEFDVDPERARADLERLLGEMEEKGLVAAEARGG
jgi:hypothetical protein